MKTTHIQRIIFICLVLSTAGLFLPWFYTDMDMSHVNGWQTLQSFPLLGFSLFGSIILLYMSKLRGLLTLCLILTPLFCIYVFLTWPILPGVTSISLINSFLSAHAGFYITLNASFIGTLLYLYKLYAR